MTPQELKNSILQLAIQGKLVEQCPEEGTAEELYQQIQVVKQQLIKAGTIKKEKLLPEITEDEKPFDIPDSWKWVKLGHLVRVIGGVSYKKGDVANNGLRILRGGNIQNMQVLLDEDDVFLPNLYNDPEKRVRKGDVIVVASTGSKAVIGKAGYVDREMPDTMIGAFLRICRPFSLAVDDYLRRIFESNFYRKRIRGLSQGTNINNVKETYITEFSIPLPPLAEQRRIVAKIEELLPYIDRYEQAWSKLENFNKRFPNDIQKSILQMAIQGKLVEQRTEEGTGEELDQQIQAEKQRLIKAGTIKKEKPLTEITEDEKPFDIPESWKWVRLGRVTTKLTDGSHNPPPNTSTGYPVISAKNVKNGLITFENVDRYTDERGFQKENQRTKISKNDIIMGIIGGSIGNVAVYTHDDKVIAQRSIAIIKTLVETQYAVVLLRSPLIQNCLQKVASGSAQGGVYLGTLGNLIIPLPPLSEQKRIVAKLKEILPLCERLK